MAGTFAASIGRSAILRSRSIRSRLHEAGRELHVIQSLGGALAAPFPVVPLEGRQLQRIGTIREQELRSQGHAASPEDRAM